jgi:hypothetical protein
MRDQNQLSNFIHIGIGFLIVLQRVQKYFFQLLTCSLKNERNNKLSVWNLKDKITNIKNAYACNTMLKDATNYP